MHLHGHEFQVAEIDGKQLAGPVRDTILLPSGGRVSSRSTRITPDGERSIAICCTTWRRECSPPSATSKDGRTGLKDR
jgi:hypothetical protein